MSRHPCFPNAQSVVSAACAALLAISSAAVADTMTLSAPSMPDFCTAGNPYYDYTFDVPTVQNGFGVQPTGYQYAVYVGANSGNSAHFFLEVEGKLLGDGTTFEVDGYGPEGFGWFDVNQYIDPGESRISVGVTRSAVVPGYDTVKIFDVKLKITYTRGADVQAPTGTFSVADDPAAPDGRRVIITNSITDNSGSVANMRFSTDGSTWSAWESYATTKSYQLPSLGSFTVFAQYRDAAGNVLNLTRPYSCAWSLLVPPSFTEGSGVQAGTGQIILPAPAESDLVFQFESGNPMVSVPSQVTVPAGASSAAFDITISDDTLLNGTRNGTITGTNVSDGTELSSVFMLLDNESATLAIDLPASVTENDGLLVGAGTVRVSQPVDVDVTVGLSSSDTTELTVPSTVIIPAGATSATFNLTVPNDTLYDGTQSATVTATVTGWTTGSAALDVLDNATVLTLTLPQYVAEGWSVCSGTVSIPNPAPADLTVALSANLSSELTLPATVTIPAWATSVAFSLTPVGDTARDGAQTVTVSASLAGWKSASVPLVVQDNEDGLFSFSQNTVQYTLGVGFTILTVTRTDATSETSVGYKSVNGTLMGGTHYQAVTGTLHFAVGETEKTVIVPILKGAIGAFSVVLENPSTYAGLNRNAQVAIQFDVEMSKQTVAAGFRGANSVYAADVDGDGDLDILGAANSDYDICWWENAAGNGTLWTKHTVDANFLGVYSVYAADMDGDGDIDIVGGSFGIGDICWWENTAGNGTVWTNHTVVTGFCGNGVILGNVSSVYVADMDGDGDLDILGASCMGNAVCWWENTAGNGTVWTERTVDTDFTDGFGVYAADMDGDGDLDILGTGGSTDGGNVCWWENTAGNGTVWTKHTVDTALTDGRSVYAADMDGDGDLDILRAGGRGLVGLVCWYENTAGNGTIWTNHIVDVGSGTSVYAADVDGDGDLDILGAKDYDDDICWWENTAGNGTVWTKHTVDADFNTPYSVYAADMDGDGDLDILGAAYIGNEICWWKNINNPPCRLYAPDRLPEGATGTVWFCLPQPALSATNLTVTASHPDRLPVLQTVPIAAGQQVISFNVATVDDSLLNGSPDVQLSLVCGETTGMATITVLDNETATLTVELPASVAENSGVLANAGTVRVARAVDADVTVQLTSSNTTELTVPAKVIIPAGATSATFNLTVIDDGLPDGEVPVSVTASLDGWGSGSAATAVRGVPYYVGLAWSKIASPQHQNTPLPVTLTAQDQYGNALASFNNPVALDAISVSALPSQNSIGTGTVPWNYPMSSAYHDARTQVIYLQNEIGGAGTITSLALQVTKLPGQTLNNWTIRMRHTSLNEYPSSPVWESTWTTVFRANTAITAPGWVVFTFTTPFLYNGINNLMVDFIHDNMGYTTDGNCSASTMGTYRSLFFRTDSSYGDPSGWPTTKNPTRNRAKNIPNILLAFTGKTSTLPLTPSTVTGFVNGVWSGTLTLGGTASAVKIIAVEDNNRWESNGFDVSEWSSISDFSRWLSNHGLVGDAAALFRQDRNGDGLPNGVEYAFGANWQPGEALQQIRFVNGRPVFEIPEQDAATLPYVGLRVLGSTDLIDWTLPVIQIEGAAAGTVWYQLDGPPTKKAFFKLEAVLK